MDDDYDFAIKTTSPNTGQENEGSSQYVNMEVPSVKGEDFDVEDNLDIFVKEEDFTVEDETFIKPKFEPAEEGTIDERLTSLPIVYTTRLDDMQVLKLKNDYSTKNCTLNSILKESIPKYNNQKPVKKPHSKRSFIALKRKLNYINKEVAKCRDDDAKEISTENSLDSVLLEASASMQTYLRNEELMKMCKPCSVVLDEIPHNSVQSKIIGREVYENKTRTQFVRVQVKKPTSCLIFQDPSGKDDVYCIKAGKITEYITLINVADVSKHPRILEYITNRIYPRTVYCCCWHQREKFINSLDYKVFTGNIKEFMRIPHYCEFDQCTCCCRPMADKSVENTEEKTSSNILLEDIEITALDKEISATLCGIKQNTIEYGYKRDWLENLLGETRDNATLINKALNYTRPNPKLSESKNKNISKNLKTKSVVRIEKDDKVEFVELQKEGDVVAYYTKTENRDQTIDHKKKLNDNTISCCWFKREQIISILKSKSPSLQRFLKIPHDCLPEECRCCCKPPQTLSPLINITLPPRSVRNYAKTKKPMQAIFYPPEKAVRSVNDLPPPQKTGRPVSDLPAFKPQAKRVKSSTRTLPKPALPVKNIAPSDSNAQKVSKSPPQNEKIRYFKVPPVDSTQELAVDSLITSILDRFKDVRLTINEDGKVAAALNAPVNTLTTSELKVLANILSHAQAQVKELGLRPGALLNAKDISNTARSVISSQDIPLKLVETERPMDAQAINSSTQTINQNVPVDKSNIKSNLQANQTVIHHNSYPIPDGNLLKSFAHMSQNNSSSLMQSYTSFIHTQNQSSIINENNSPNNFIPKIANVFSLKDAENNASLSETVKMSALNAWSETEHPESATKRKAVNIKSHPQSKIRVVDPAKLGLTSTTEDTSTNMNLINTQLHPYSTQPTFSPSGVTLLPTSGVMGSGIVPSFPRLNAELIRTTSTVTSNSNNFIVVNSLGSVGSGDNVYISPTNTNNLQLVTPLNLNSIAQNIPIDPVTKSSNVFTISNLDKTTVAEPRLLNANPVADPKKMPSNCPSLLVPISSNNLQNKFVFYS